MLSNFANGFRSENGAFAQNVTPIMSENHRELLYAEFCIPMTQRPTFQEHNSHATVLAKIKYNSDVYKLFLQKGQVSNLNIL